MYKQIEGFILSGHAIDQDDRLILKLYGQSDAGSFFVTIDHFKNYFYVETKNISAFKNLDGTPVEKVECKNIRRKIV